MNPASQQSCVPVTPDFIDHLWHALRSAVVADGFVHLEWDDGVALDAYGLWLAENAEGVGLEPESRESMLDPRYLPDPDVVDVARVADDGALEIGWSDGRLSRVHPGWLHHIATRRHLPTDSIPPPRVWTTADFDEPPTIDGTDILDDDSVLEAWLSTLVEFGLCRLTGLPVDHGFVERLMARVAPIRDTNFGPIWSVEATADPDSTANTRLDLGQHTDLPTRELPPGYQFLHCIENSVAGGSSRMSDGLAVVEAIREQHPDAFDALTSLDWVFCNRSPDAEHRWIGPIIDRGARTPILRAFYPVRRAPHMATVDVPRAYEALRIFARTAHDPRFQISFEFRPGDLVAFDNHRILHGRDAFEITGTRRLRGCYADQDDVFSRLRVLRRG